MENERFTVQYAKYAIWAIVPALVLPVMLTVLLVRVGELNVLVSLLTAAILFAPLFIWWTWLMTVQVDVDGSRIVMRRRFGRTRVMDMADITQAERLIRMKRHIQSGERLTICAGRTVIRVNANMREYARLLSFVREHVAKPRFKTRKIESSGYVWH